MAQQTARPAAEVVSDRIRSVREQRELSQRDVIRKLEELGVALDPGTLSRTERGRIEGDDERRVRDVPVAELLQLAAVLNVSPVNLIVPEDPGEQVEVAPELRASARTIRSWIQGVAPLDPETQDEREYMLPAPDDEWERYQTQRHTAVRKLRDLETQVRAAAARQLPPDGRDRPASEGARPGPLANTLADQFVELGARLLPMIGDLMGETDDEDDRAARTLAAGLAEMLLALQREGYGSPALKRELRALVDDLDEDS